jgi:CBS domain-containing protein
LKLNVTASPAPTIVSGLLFALRSHVPFAAMSDASLEHIVRASQLRYFAPGDTILAPAPERPAACFIIKQGTVRGERPRASADGDAVALWELSAGDMFPLGALLGHRGVTSVYRATRDTFCLVFPAGAFDTVLAASPVFADFCTRRLAHLLDLARADLQAEYAANVTTRYGMDTSLTSVLKLDPVTVTPATTIGAALMAMEARRIGSLPVVDAHGSPLGIFTRQDVIGRVVLPQRELATAISEVMSAPALTLPADATSGDAALLMAQRGIRHVVVTDGEGRVAGVVSERDLFGLHRLSLREISSAVRRAGDIDALVQCAADIRGLSFALVAQGVASAPLTRMISSLNDQLTSRVLEITSAKFALHGFAVCWLGMGSEGRGEQTIATDQDNAILFLSEDPAQSDAGVRDRLLPFAREINETLDRCGYPLCKGGVMAMNPQWCLSLSAWSAAFAQWIDHGGPDSLLRANIFFDFRSLWGRAELAQRLRDDIATWAKANRRFLKQMSDNALRNRPPLSWRGELKAGADANGAEAIDLKISGSMPLTDAARILALATGVVATGTSERLRQAGARMGIAADDIRGWCDAFDYLQMLRLRTQHRRAAGDLPASANPNLLPLASVSQLDQRILKESLRQVRKLQQRLEVDYP